MKKKILITRKLLRSNEEKAAKLWDVKLNSNKHTTNTDRHNNCTKIGRAHV